MIGKALTKVFGSKNDREVKVLLKVVEQINALEPTVEPLSDIQLQEKTTEFKKRYTDGEALDDLLFLFVLCLAFWTNAVKFHAAAGNLISSVLSFL
ncbi:MAG: hypothetical protein D3903_09930 [Candidatus Electrothrix sp. GM3_4]|nr:hypothetical protein [Candidatus Electrothrix sp. GM3_4]